MKAVQWGNRDIQWKCFVQFSFHSFSPLFLLIHSSPFNLLPFLFYLLFIFRQSSLPILLTTMYLPSLSSQFSSSPFPSHSSSNQSPLDLLLSFFPHNSIDLHSVSSFPFPQFISIALLLLLPLLSLTPH